MSHKAPQVFVTRGAPPYARFLERYLRERAALQGALDDALGEVKKLLSSRVASARVTGRVKSPVSTWRKMRRYGVDLDDVHDIVGLRAIVQTEPECRAALAAVLDRWGSRCLRFRDYIAHPKPNGYQSLHLCVAPKDGHRFELQIRTHAMHLRCQEGLASHAVYKRSLSAPSPRYASVSASSRCA